MSEQTEKRIAEKTRKILTQKNGEMNRIIAIKKFDENHLIAHWRYPIAGFDALIFDKNN